MGILGRVGAGSRGFGGGRERGAPDPDPIDRDVDDEAAW